MNSAPACTADLSRCRLYGILDLSYVDVLDAGAVVNEMLDGGINVLQLRAKGRSLDEVASLARSLRGNTRDAGVPLIVNDYPAIAKDISAEGAHVGQDDLSVTEARGLAGPGSLIGKSTHSLEQALAAEAEGADYIGFGPLFATATKPDYRPTGLEQVAEVHARVRIPIFCIGGIKQANLAQVLAAGARRIVIVSELLEAKNIGSYLRKVKAQLS